MRTIHDAIHDLLAPIASPLMRSDRDPKPLPDTPQPQPLPDTPIPGEPGPTQPDPEPVPYEWT